MVILTSKQYKELYHLISNYSYLEFKRGLDSGIFGVNSSSYDTNKINSDTALNDIILFLLDHSFDTDKVSYKLDSSDLPFSDCDNLHRVIYEDNGNMTQFDEDWSDHYE